MNARLIISIFCFLGTEFGSAVVIQETYIPSEALKMFLKNRDTIKETDDGYICAPLNYGGGKVSDGFSNGDKTCYLALKHDYMTTIRKYRMTPVYHKGSCESKLILKGVDTSPLFKWETIHDVVTEKKLMFRADAVYCHIKGMRWFYVANTSEKNYYAILDPATVLWRDNQVVLTVKAILKLVCKGEEIYQMFKYCAKKDEPKINNEKKRPSDAGPSNVVQKKPAVPMKRET